MAATQVVRSEWTKIRSVRVHGVDALARRGRHHRPRHADLDAGQERVRRMPRGQAVLRPHVHQLRRDGPRPARDDRVGVLVVSNEYSTGMIRTSLAAVPQRGTFLFSKIAVAGGLPRRRPRHQLRRLLPRAGDARLPPGAIGDPGVLRAVIGGGLYMTLIAMFSMGVAAMLRSPMLSLGILMPFFFLISNILWQCLRDEEDRPIPARPGRQQDHAGGRRPSATTPVRPMGRARDHGAVGGAGARRGVCAAQETGRVSGLKPL